MPYKLSNTVKLLMKGLENIEKLPPNIDSFLKKIEYLSGENELLISSYLRDGKNQARIMCNMSICTMKGMYKEDFTNIAKEILKEYLLTKGIKYSEGVKISQYDEVREKCENKFYELIKKKKGFDHISGHAIDIDPNSIPTEVRRLKFHHILTELLKNKEIKKYISPYTKEINGKTDPAFHIAFF